MSFLFQLLRNSRASSANDGLQTLEAAYRKQVAALAQARVGIADVLAAEKRLEREALGLAAARERFRIAALDAQRRGDEPAMLASRENEAFVAYQRDRLLEQAGDVRRSRLALESMMEKVRLRVELFRTEKLAIGARYVAARAATRSGMSVAGLGDEMREVERLTLLARQTSHGALATLEATDAAPRTGGEGA